MHCNKNEATFSMTENVFWYLETMLRIYHATLAASSPWGCSKLAPMSIRSIPIQNETGFFQQRSKHRKCKETREKKKKSYDMLVYEPMWKPCAWSNALKLLTYTVKTCESSVSHRKLFQSGMLA